MKNLTARELQILTMVCEGMRSKEIARELSIAPRTVEAHKVNIQCKLEVTRSAQMVAYAVSHHLINTG